VGNLVGGVSFVGLTLYATHARTGASRRPVPAQDRAVADGFGVPFAAAESGIPAEAT
jgi:hypothetical protein